MQLSVLNISHVAANRHGAHAVEHQATVSDGGAVPRQLRFLIECETLSVSEIAPSPESFVLALLPFCMQSGADLACEHPVDEQLLYNINTQLIPFLCTRYTGWRAIRVHAPTRSVDVPVSATGLHALGMSCGLDALTAFAELTGADAPREFKPEALLFNDIGAFGRGTEKRDHDLALVERFAAAHKLPLIRVTSNMGSFGGPHYTKTYSLRGAAVAWALKGLVRRVTYASGTDYAGLGHLDAMSDGGAFDPIVLPMMSSRSLDVYTSGFRHNRSDKFELLMQHPALIGYLNTCLRTVAGKGGYINCGTCKKCSELLFRAEAMGCMHALEPTFNVRAFKRLRTFLAFKLIYHAHMPSPSDNSVYTLQTLSKYKARLGVVPCLAGWLAAGFKWVKAGVSRAVNAEH